MVAKVGLSPGDRVIWTRSDGRRVPAVVERVGPRRVLIRAAWSDTRSIALHEIDWWTEKRRWVDPTRLSPRTEYVEVLDRVRGGTIGDR